jgi:hypothetical protein
MAISRARPDWLDWPDTATPIRAQDLDLLDRAVYDLRRTVFNVKDQEFGATGDGSTNDTAAIQAAISAAEAESRGGIVYLPTGVYSIRSPLLVTKDNVEIRGNQMGNPTDGTPPAALARGGTVLLLPSSFSGEWAIRVGQPAASATRVLGMCHVSDLSIRGGAGLATGTGGIFLQTLKTNVQRVLVNNVTGDGIQIKSFASGGGFPTNAYDNFLSQIQVETILAGNGVSFINSTDNLVQHSLVSDVRSGHCVYGNDGGIDNHIQDCHIGGASASGIRGEHPWWTITGNRFHGCGDHTIYLSNGATNQLAFLISDNTIVGPISSATDNSFDGIHVTASLAARGGIIGPHSFRTTSGSSRRFRYGINIASTNVTNCTVYGPSAGYGTSAASEFGTAPISDSGTGTVIVGGRDANMRSFDKLSNGVMRLTGTGTPEGAVTAPVGSTYHRSDGGAGTSFYVKESGAGNTGWVAK